MFQFANFYPTIIFLLVWKPDEKKRNDSCYVHQPAIIPVLRYTYVQVLFYLSLDIPYVSKSVPYQQINRITSYLSTQDEKLQTIHVIILNALTTHDNGTCDISQKHDLSW